MVLRVYLVLSLYIRIGYLIWASKCALFGISTSFSTTLLEILSTILIFLFIIFTSFPENIYLSPTFAVHNTPPEIIHTHSREAEHQGATRGLLEWPSKRVSNGEDVVHSQLSRSFSRNYRLAVYLLLKSSYSSRLTATCTNLHCYSSLPNLKTKCLFLSYLDSAVSHAAFLWWDTLLQSHLSHQCFVVVYLS